MIRIVEHAGLTDVGRQRHTNEDAFLEHSPLFVVADGMGGARAGEVAAKLAVEAFKETGEAEGTPEERLAGTVRRANRKIYELARDDASHAGMGTTLTAAMVTDGEVAIAHVGDSRAYRFRDDELELLTDDHSLVGEMVRAGKLSPEDAEGHPQKSIITRALGPEPDVEVDTHTYPARADDVYLLCSDGLTGMLSEQRIAQILRARSSLDQAARTLVEDANARGGRDNITAVLFRLGEAEEDSDDPDTLTGAETQAVSAEDVKAAGVEPEPRRDMTMVMDARTAEKARTEAAAAPAPKRPPVGSRRRRRVLGAIGVLVVIAALVTGFYVGTRQFYFVGTDASGVLAVYRGVPYELPLGLDLYEEEFVSTVPARSLPAGQRRAVLDHQLRGRSDAFDLVRQLEQGRTQP